MSSTKTTLRHLVERKGWRTFETFQHHFDQAARRLSRLSDPRFSSVSVSRTQFNRWLDGKAKPRPLARRVLKELFGLDIDVLLGPITVASLEAASSINLVGFVTDQRNLEEEIITSGHESSEHAAAAARAVDSATIDQLQDDIAKVARAYPTTPLLTSFSEARRVQKLAYEQIDHTGRPAQLNDLYLIAGEACGILATCAFDLGYSETATEHARSAERYARMIGHGGLLAWALGMRALVCYWTPLQRPHESLSLVGKGLAQAPAGTPTLRLRAIQARAHAYIGDSRGAHEAARLAHEQLDAVGHDLIHDEIGGEFSFDGARLARCLGSAYVMLGEAEPAIAEASTALALYAERSPAARMPKVAAEAQIDLAHAYLIQESLDAAIEALRPVFDLGQNQRIEGITGRLAAVRNHLARSTRLRGAREAIALGQEIEAFIAHPAGELVPAIMPSS